MTGRDRVLAIDLGGTHLRAASVTAEGRIVDKARRETPADRGPDAVIDAILACAHEVAGPDVAAGHSVACVAAPGPLDARTGIVYATPNLAGWRDVPLRDRLAAGLGVPVWLQNDANLAGLGEALLGAGRGRDPIVYLTVSTGVGGGIVEGGAIVGGASGLAGELGHVIVQAGGPACQFGHRGCLEGLASGTAIARAAAMAIAAGRATTLNSTCASAPAPTAREVAGAATAGDPLARELFSAAGRALGLAIGGFINILDPAMVVVGGGVAAAWPLFAPAMHVAMGQVVLTPERRSVSVVRAALGDNAGLIGAALYAVRQGPEPPHRTARPP